MPTFLYTAKTHPQKTIQGNIEAESEQDAINKLANLGYFPISVKIEAFALAKGSFWYFRKISNKEITSFTRQLSSLIESGVNILNSFNIISAQISNKYFKAIINDIAMKIKAGRSLSESLSSHPYLFSKLYTSIILSGETGGNLEQALQGLSDFLEKEEEVKSSIYGSLIYPFFIFVVGAVTVAILLGFVIPRLVAMFEDMGQLLPLPTRILIGISGFFQNYAWFICAASLIFIFLLSRLHRKAQGKALIDKIKLKLPLFSNIILKTEVSRMMRTLSLLLSGGVPMINSLDISMSIVGNYVLKSEIKKFKDQIAGGQSLSRCLKDSKLFPAYVTNIVAIGEETGGLEKSFMRIADVYEKEVDRLVKTLTQMLEPAIILFMGIIVGFIVLAMLLPIFQINLIVR